MTYRFPVALLFVLSSACTVTDRTPIVHMQGVNVSQYGTDLEECRGYADQVDVEKELALGAVIGAISLGAVGAFFGNSDLTGRAVSVGAVSGTTQGAVNVISERNKVLRNCMDTKGYTVLN